MRSEVGAAKTELNIIPAGITYNCFYCCPVLQSTGSNSDMVHLAAPDSS